MGEMADYYSCRDTLNEEELWQEEYNQELRIKNKTWKQKDGTLIKIKDMTNSHIINALNYLKKR